MQADAHPKMGSFSSLLTKKQSADFDAAILGYPFVIRSGGDIVNPKILWLKPPEWERAWILGTSIVPVKRGYWKEVE